jgi:lambda family phage minor tail protein L
MSNVIATDLQGSEVTSGLIDLFHINLPNGTVIYFHPGLDDDLTDVRFRDKIAPTNPVTAGNFIIGNSYTIVSGTGFTSIGATNNNAGTVFIATGIGSGSGTATQNDYSIRTYEPMPMMMDGLDLQADGAPTRPSITIANVGTLLSTHLGGFNHDDLIGERVIRRQTLKKYLYGESGDSSPPVEFPTQEYIIDRIAGEDGISITYELAAPFDLENIQLPRRVVVGKFCSWKFQGHDTGVGGGCTWKKDSSYKYRGVDGNIYSHTAYFNVDDSPLILAETISGTYNASTAYTEVDYITHNSKFWVCILPSTGNEPSSTSPFWKEVFKWTEHATSGTNYTVGNLVRYNSETIWKCLRNHSSPSPVPEEGKGFWTREDLCGKILNSCKIRYGAVPTGTTGANQKPRGRTNSAARLPFGSFPGTLKY